MVNHRVNLLPLFQEPSLSLGQTLEFASVLTTDARIFVRHVHAPVAKVHIYIYRVGVGAHVGLFGLFSHIRHGKCGNMLWCHLSGWLSPWRCALLLRRANCKAVMPCIRTLGPRIRCDGLDRLGIGHLWVPSPSTLRRMTWWLRRSMKN